MSNIITFHGRLTKDAGEPRYTPSGTAVLNFTVAEDVGYGDRKHTNFHECALFGKRAEGGIVPYLVKGQAVFISGELTVKPPREHNGKSYNDVKIAVNTLDLIGGKGQSERKSQTEPADDLDSDIPF